MARTISSVRIVVTLEVTTGATYGDEWTLADLRKQAKHEALCMLRAQLAGKLIRFHEEPRVIVVTAEEQPS